MTFVNLNRWILYPCTVLLIYFITQCSSQCADNSQTYINIVQHSWDTEQYENISAPIEFVFDQSRNRLYSFHISYGTISSAFISWDSQNNLEYIKGLSLYQFAKDAIIFDESNSVYTILEIDSDYYFTIAVWNTTDGSLNQIFEDTNPYVITHVDAIARFNPEKTAIYMSSLNYSFDAISVCKIDVSTFSVDCLEYDSNFYFSPTKIFEYVGNSEIFMASIYDDSEDTIHFDKVTFPSDGSTGISSTWTKSITKGDLYALESFSAVDLDQQICFNTIVDLYTYIFFEMNLIDGSLIGSMYSVTVDGLVHRYMKRYSNKVYSLFETDYGDTILIYDESTNAFSNYTGNHNILCLGFASQFINQEDIMLGVSDKDGTMAYIFVNKIEGLSYNNFLVQGSSDIQPTSDYSLYDNNVTTWTILGSDYNNSGAVLSITDPSYNSSVDASYLCIGTNISYSDLEVNQSDVTISLTGLTTSSGSAFQSVYNYAYHDSNLVPGWLTVNSTNGNIIISRTPVLKDDKDFVFNMNFTYNSSKDDLQQVVTLRVKACTVENCDRCERANSRQCLNCTNGYIMDNGSCVQNKYNCFIKAFDTKSKCIGYTIAIFLSVIVAICMIVLLSYILLCKYKKKTKRRYKRSKGKEQTEIAIKQNEGDDAQAKQDFERLQYQPEKNISEKGSKVESERESEKSNEEGVKASVLEDEKSTNEKEELKMKNDEYLSRQSD